MNLFNRKKQRDEMGQSMAASIVNSDLSRPQSSQDQLDQSMGINPYLLQDKETMGLIQSLAFVRGESDDVTVIPKFAALAIQSGYTPRASNLSKIDAEIGIITARMIARRVKMKMTETEYEAGGALVVDAILNTIVTPNYLSGIGGFTAKMTKVSPRSMEVTYREDKGRAGKSSGENFGP